jgi:hypothetical protein
MSTPWELDAFLHEASQPTHHEHNLMALALNKYFVEIGVSQTVPYIDRQHPPKKPGGPGQLRLPCNASRCRDCRCGSCGVSSN